MEVTNKAVMEALDGLPPVKCTAHCLQRKQSTQLYGIMQKKHDIKIEGLKKPKSDIHEGEEAEEEEY